MTEKQGTNNDQQSEPELTRRDMLKYAGLAAGASTGLLGWGQAFAGGTRLNASACPAPSAAPKAERRSESREFVFDFSGFATHNHHLVLIAGRGRQPVKKMSRGRWKQLQKKHPILKRVPFKRATHYVKLDMPADAVQWCYVRRIDRRARDGSWGIAHQFIHHPIDALTNAMRLTSDSVGEENYPVPVKWEGLGLSTGDILGFADPIGMDVFKDQTDTAAALVQAHPEIASGDSHSSAYVYTNIVNGDQATKQSVTECADVITKLGPIEPQQNFSCADDTIVENQSGYGTNIPICNDDTDPPVVATNCFGEKQYVPIYNDAIAQTSGQAMVTCVQAVKDDTKLGGNITTNPDSTQGLIWRSQDGVSNVDQSDGLTSGTSCNPQNSKLPFKTNDITPGHGYSCEVCDVEPADGLNGVITVELKNWYVRFLGIYVRYFDGAGEVLDITDDQFTSDQEATYFPLQSCCNSLNTTYDRFITMLGPEFEVLGIPVSETKTTIKVPLPTNAVTAQIVAGGMGNKKYQRAGYSEAEIAGKAMTGTMNLGVPAFFMVSNAAAGLTPMSKALQNNQQLIFVLPLVIQGFADLFASVELDDPSAFKSLSVSTAKVLVKAGMKEFVAWWAKFIAEGETEEDALEGLPVVGQLMSGLYALGTAAQIAETSVEVSQSPSVFLFDINIVQDVDVIISPDPRDAGGNWPATARTMEVQLLFSKSGTPYKKFYTFPGTTVSGPITVTFEDIPVGGKITAACLVEAESGCAVGRGSTDPLDNAEANPLTIAFAIVEQQISLTAATVYSHKEVIELDSNGEHKWLAAPDDPPSETSPSGCGFENGQLCKLAGLTINSTAGDVGYVWQSYSDSVGTCSNAFGSTQLYRFANISITEDPQSGYFISDCGFTTTPFVVYDLINTKNGYYLDTSSTGPGYKGGIIRQIRLGETPDFDGPNSGEGFGKIRFESSALLLHPAGQIISIAADQNKFEVLQLAESPIQGDENLPFSQPYGGKGTRAGLMGGPTLAALAPDGSVLVLESDNKRIQAFDLNANSIPLFAEGAYYVPLREQDSGFNVTYLDMGVEFKGYIFVLYKLSSKSDGSESFALDVYSPDGSFLATTPDFVAARMTVNYWRDIYTENFQVLKLPDGNPSANTEPSISHWIPSVSCS